MTMTKTSFGRDRNAASKFPRIGVGDSMRLTTSSMSPPGSPELAGTTPPTPAASSPAVDQIISLLASKSISIVSAASADAWCAESFTSTTGVALFRNRRVVDPDGTFSAVNGTWCSPCIARSHLSGRENVDSLFQRIVFGKLIDDTIPGSASFKTSTAALPVVFTFAQMYSPSFSRSAGSTPFFLQKPRAAFVGVVPSSSNARDSGGPRLRSSLLSCDAARFATLTTMRRGVAPYVTPSCFNPAVSRHAFTAFKSCFAPVVTSAAGSSSVPISTKKSAASVGGGAFETTGSPTAACSHSPSGYPSSSRRSTHSCADSLASFRMLAKSFARSVTPTAPRASRMLKVWLAFRS
mmetsp:Transcript_14151/g.50870  ORF Transcript_14151/g.50870 Transcript_14151/m.50870 type:complete len:351 (-) Transcript_14151:1007-2059(-)